MNASRMAAIVLVMLVIAAYPLSFGPVMRMHVNAAGFITPLSGAEEVFYAPLNKATKSRRVARVLVRYVNLWLPDGTSLVVGRGD